MTDLQPHFQRLGQKLQQLLKQHESLRRDNEKLSAHLAQQQQELDAEQKKVRVLEDQVAILKTAAVNMDDNAKKEFEKKINLYLRDIDKVISHLNQ